MKEIPILFSTTMVQAILAGRKTMTRRILKQQPVETKAADGFRFLNVPNIGPIWDAKDKCPYGQPGDLLWVRETFQMRGPAAIQIGHAKYYYKAGWNGCNEAGWKPSIHMPKAATRIWLQVTDVRVERLQDITKQDAIAEGIEQIEGKTFRKIFGNDEVNYDDAPYFLSPVFSFQSLWHSINGADSWAQNPWVWVVSFKVISEAGKPTIISIDSPGGSIGDKNSVDHIINKFKSNNHGYSNL